MLFDSKKRLSVNFHLWQPCNYNCGFCFAGFEDVKKSILPKGHLSQTEAENVVRQLGEFGFGKITFAGGEPTLCPWLEDLMAIAKRVGMVTMLVTNGSRLTKETLNQYRPVLDWIVLSIDSIEPEINFKGGRFHHQRMLPDATHYLGLIEMIHRYGFKFKINTVVHRFNKNEKIADFIEMANPLRWKIFKVFPVANQNGQAYDNYEITKEEFFKYLERNSTAGTKHLMVAEDNDAMSESYLMIDPAGRFFDNSTGSYKYSEPVLSAGVNPALGQIVFDFEKYLNRGAVYSW